MVNFLTENIGGFAIGIIVVVIVLFFLGAFFSRYLIDFFKNLTGGFIFSLI